jgi:hypothetical protein
VIAADSLGIEEEECNNGNDELTLAFGPSLWNNLLLSCYTKVQIFFLAKTLSSARLTPFFPY